MKIFFCKLRDALGFHITPTTEQPKGRCVCALGLRSWAPGTSFAEKTARRNVAPEHWVFLAGTGGGLDIRYIKIARVYVPLYCFYSTRITQTVRHRACRRRCRISTPLASGLSTLCSTEASLPSSGVGVAYRLSSIAESAPSTWVLGGTQEGKEAQSHPPHHHRALERPALHNQH